MQIPFDYHFKYYSRAFGFCVLWTMFCHPIHDIYKTMLISMFRSFNVGDFLNITFTTISVITQSVVTAGLLVIFTDWGFSQLWLKRY